MTKVSDFKIFKLSSVKLSSLSKHIKSEELIR